MCVGVPSIFPWCVNARRNCDRRADDGDDESVTSPLSAQLLERERGRERERERERARERERERGRGREREREGGGVPSTEAE